VGRGFLLPTHRLAHDWAIQPYPADNDVQTRPVRKRDICRDEIRAVTIVPTVAFQHRRRRRFSRSVEVEATAFKGPAT
jgi:hypothetical protein